MPLALNPPGVGNGTVTLSWSAVEGGRYQVDASTNLSGWTVLATNVSPTKTAGGYATASGVVAEFFHVALTGVAAFDPVTTGGGTGGSQSAVPGGSASRGTTVTVTITLPANPPQPPANMVPTSVTLAGSITATGLARPTAGTVQAT